MADYSTYQLPHRRAVGEPVAQKQTMYSQPQQSPTHYHSRTASSAIFTNAAPHPSSYATKPMPNIPLAQQQYAQAQHQYAPHQPNRRMTNSTVSSRDSIDRSQQVQGHPQQYAAAAPSVQQQVVPVRVSESNLRRSTSSRSQASSLGPTSYVALLRKQKATVWCERTQHMDPRIQMQAKAARARAANEIMKSSMGRTALPGAAPSVHSGGVLGRNKNKHAGRVQTGGGGVGANLAAGVGVPMRLSASEVGDEEEGDDDGVYAGGAGGVHRRSGSGRSSLGAQTATTTTRLAAPRTSTLLSYGSSQPGSSAGHTPPGAAGTMTSEVASIPLEHVNSFGSTGSEERREREMGEVGDMEAPSAVATQEKKLSKDELSRRGSVDERSATMRGAAGAMRLFVANPDSDSD